MSGEMKRLRGEDVFCSQASTRCLLLDAKIKFVSLRLVNPTFYFLPLSISFARSEHFKWSLQFDAATAVHL